METISFLGFYEPLSSMTHLLAAGIALVAGFFLAGRGRGSRSRLVSLMVYTFCMVFLFSMSGVFHLLEEEGEARGVLQRLDYAGIWVMIAGTFTPIHVILFRGPWRWGVLTVVGVLAINGLVFQVIYFHDFPEWLSLTLFLTLGWSGLFSMYHLYRKFSHESLRLMLYGALLYSFGAIIDFARWPTIIPGVLGPHEIFHIAIIVAAAMFWLFIYNWSGHPVKDQLYFYVQVHPDGRHQAYEKFERISIEAPNRESLKEQIREQIRDRYHVSYDPQIKLTFADIEYL